MSHVWRWVWIAFLSYGVGIAGWFVTFTGAFVGTARYRRHTFELAELVGFGYLAGLLVLGAFYLMGPAAWTGRTHNPRPGSAASARRTR